MSEAPKLKGSQKQDSRQSGKQGPGDEAGGRGASGKGRTGIGSSQGQDTEHRESEGPRERPSAGTADIERGGSQDTGAQESLVQDPTGAFKERP